MEVLEEVKSSRRFLFFSRLFSLELAEGGDEVEPLSSQEFLASSPSWLQKQKDQDQPKLAL
jgi:hypothetical protein